jgi:hypothetical protein
LGWCRARAMYKKGDGVLASAESKEERVLLLESWLAMEEGLADAGDAEAIRAKMPRQIRKKRPIQVPPPRPAPSCPPLVCAGTRVWCRAAGDSSLAQGEQRSRREDAGAGYRRPWSVWRRRCVPRLSMQELRALPRVRSTGPASSVGCARGEAVCSPSVRACTGTEGSERRRRAVAAREAAREAAGEAAGEAGGEAAILLQLL